MKNRSKASIGCPYCASIRMGETDWEQNEDRKTKVVKYSCGTELWLNKIGAKYQNNRFVNKCSVPLEIEGAPI